MSENKKYTKEELEMINSACTPGDKKCMGQTIHKCRVSGTGWFDTKVPCKKSN